MTLRIGTAQRRARLATRHRLARPARSDDVVAITDSVVALHSSDPASVYLSAAARMKHPALAPMDRALYDAHTLIRHHAMRRTLWVMTPEVTRLAHAACTLGLLPAERKRLAALVEASGVADHGEAWLDAARRDTAAALHDLGTATARQLGEKVPELTAPLHLAVGKRYAASPSAHTRVLLLLGFEGAIVRGAPSGSWINSQYRWAPMDTWLPGGLGHLDPGPARVELARRWLRSFGPGTTTDLQWWAGWTLGATRAALHALDAVAVDLDHGDGWVLPDDVDPVPEPAPWIALLPGLDPTTMGWKHRDWYLGEHAARLFDRNGNAGPTIWVDGEIVGAWVQRASGEIVTRVLGDVGRDGVRKIDAAADAVGRLLGETRHTVRFPSPILADLLA